MNTWFECCKNDPLTLVKVATNLLVQFGNDFSLNLKLIRLKRVHHWKSFRPAGYRGLSLSTKLSWVSLINKRSNTFSGDPAAGLSIGTAQKNPQRNPGPKGDQRGRTQKVHVKWESQVTGLGRSAIQTEMSLMAQKMCPRGELGLLPLRPQTSIKYLFRLATWRRQGLERDWRDAATVASTLISLICPAT